MSCNDWINVKDVLDKHDMKHIIRMHKEQIHCINLLVVQENIPEAVKIAGEEEKRLWRISLFRNVNGFDPTSELPEGWEDSL